jgi:hypothetical protein
MDVSTFGPSLPECGPGTGLTRPTLGAAAFEARPAWSGRRVSRSFRPFPSDSRRNPGLRMMLFPGWHIRRLLNPHAGHAPGVARFAAFVISPIVRRALRPRSASGSLRPFENCGQCGIRGISTAPKGRRKKEASKPGPAQVEEIFRANRPSQKGPALLRTCAANSPE